VLSALGMLVADVTRDYSASVLKASRDLSPRDLEHALAPLVRQAGRELAAEGFQPSRRAIERLVDVRYVGQSYEITVPFTPGYRREFDRRHGRTFGYMNPARPTEVVNVRVKAAGITEKPSRPFVRPRRAVRPTPSAVRPGRFGGRVVKVAFYRWDGLVPGAAAPGPAVLTSGDATVVVPPGFRFQIDGYGNVIATRRTR
jgi:N-methylhydantoinase A/oxoprolinase/acetone carboxylase beta subunit